MRGIEKFIVKTLGKRSVIEDGPTYVRENYKSVWKRVRTVHLRGFTPHLMKDYKSTEHCSLASVTAVLDYYVEKGDLPGTGVAKNGVAKSNSLDRRREIFAVVQCFAYSRLLSFPQIGTFPWNIARIARGAGVELGLKYLLKIGFFSRTRRD